MNKIIKILVASVLIVILFTWRNTVECMNGNCLSFYIKIAGSIVVISLLVIAVVKEKKK